MAQRDSVDKIVLTYVAAVASEPFSYGDTLVVPKTLIVSPLLLRGFTCPVNCGGCCPRFSLDYLPDEPHPYQLERRDVMINGRAHTIFSDRQSDQQGHFCRHLGSQDGRCQIHLRRPFSCDFELIRFLDFDDRWLLLSKLFGRGWAMKRVDGGRGALCEMLPTSPMWINEVVRKLERLEEWCRYFGVTTRIPAILQWVRNGTHKSPLILT